MILSPISHFVLYHQLNLLWTKIQNNIKILFLQTNSGLKGSYPVNGSNSISYAIPLKILGWQKNSQ